MSHDKKEGSESTRTTSFFKDAKDHTKKDADDDLTPEDQELKDKLEKAVEQICTNSNVSSAIDIIR